MRYAYWGNPPKDLNSQKRAASSLRISIAAFKIFDVSPVEFDMQGVRRLGYKKADIEKLRERIQAIRENRQNGGGLSDGAPSRSPECLYQGNLDT